MGRVRILTAVLFVVSASVLAARAAPPIFPLKEVQPGLKGECRTVFAGTKIDSFPFEVMGVAKDFAGPGRDIIWCRMIGDPTGQMVVAAGMSGSPCFIGGRNMGALAYGWTFNKDPIFGVQPIESMLELFEFKGNTRRWSGSWFAAHPSPFRATELPLLLKTLAGFAAPPALRAREETVQAIPLPLEINGLNPLISERVLRGFREAGFDPMLSAGGGVSAAADAAEMAPGAALTGVIARGDLNRAATGTLTWRDGDKVLAFGHPFLGVGASRMPMGKAEIVGVVSSYERSFKMANKGAVVGTLVQDRMSAVAGRIGDMPRMAPMTVTVRRPGAAERSYKLEFYDCKFFTPMVYQTALLQFLANVMERSEESTLRLKSEVQLEGLPPLRFENEFAGERFTWAMDAVMQPALQMMPLYQNDFGTPVVKAITVEAEIQPVIHSATIEELVAEPLKARAGETIRLRAGFQPWHGPRFYREYEVPIPEEVKGGEIELTVADAAKADQIVGNSNSILSMFGFQSASSVQPRNLLQLVETLNERHRSDHLYLFAVKNTEGLCLQNQRLAELPGSVRELLASDQSADHPRSLTTAVLSKTEVDFGQVVCGSRSVKIEIK